MPLKLQTTEELKIIWQKHAYIFLGTLALISTITYLYAIILLLVNFIVEKKDLQMGKEFPRRGEWTERYGRGIGVRTFISNWSTN